MHIYGQLFFYNIFEEIQYEYAKKNLNSYFTGCTKINSKKIIDLDVKTKTTKLAEYTCNPRI
jgi:hypothetical protein